MDGETGEGVLQAEVTAGEEILLVELVVRLGRFRAMVAGEDRPKVDVLHRHRHRRTIPNGGRREIDQRRGEREGETNEG